MVQKDLIKKFKNFISKSNNPFIFEEIQNPIILKDNNKRIIGYKDNVFTRPAKDLLNRYNQASKNYKISFNNQLNINLNTDTNNYKLSNNNPISSYTHRIRNYITQKPAKYRAFKKQKIYERAAIQKLIQLCEWAHIPELLQLKRVFNNNSFKLGGRFYGNPIQRLPKEIRKDLSINGDPCIEIDYSCLHISMAYHQKGLDLPSTPYIFKRGDPMRDIIKLIINTSINSKNLKETISSVTKELNFNKQDLKNSLMHSPYVKGNLSNKIKALITKIRKHHAPIDHIFCSGMGLTFQKIDSDMASEIIDHFTKKGIPIIPIHDSFIVQKQYEEQRNRCLRGVLPMKFLKC